ncbi:MAG: spore protease YyaC [Bacillota bacterium]
MVYLIIDSIHYSDRLGVVKALRCLEQILPEPGVNITYFCIGSDLSTGDCFGPLTGTLLKNMGLKNVIGSLDDTVNASNLEERLLQAPKDSHIVAVDATMGHYKDVGTLKFIRGPIRPGAAMKKELPPVGETSVVFNVAPFGIANFLTLGCASFNKVWLGSNLLARAISVVSYRRKKIAVSHRLSAL